MGNKLTWTNNTSPGDHPYKPTQEKETGNHGVEPLAKKYNVKVDDATCKGCGICVNTYETKGGKIIVQL